MTLYLQLMDTLPLVCAYKAVAEQLLDVQTGDTVLELGCAFGHAAQARRKRGIHTLGIDRDPVKIACAHQTLARDAGSQFLAADFTDPKLWEDLGSQRFAACLLDRVIQYIGTHPDDTDVTNLLANIASVLQPAARLVICDSDWSQLQLLNTNRLYSSWLTDEHIRKYLEYIKTYFYHQIPNPSLASHLPDILRGQDTFATVEHRVESLLYAADLSRIIFLLDIIATTAQRAGLSDWLAVHQQVMHDPHVLFELPMYMVVAIKAK